MATVQFIDGRMVEHVRLSNVKQVGDEGSQSATAHFEGNEYHVYNSIVDGFNNVWYEQALKPLDVVDDRTELKKLDKVQACGYCLMARGEWTGPAHWLVNETSACDADILRIARERNGEWLLPALVDIAERNAMQMVKLETPIPCEMGLLAQEEQRCMGLAYWRASGFAECDECIVNCLERHPDSRECLSEALIDLRERHLKIDARVRIQMGEQSGKLGTVYNHLPSRPAPWHVRPDGWPDNEPGIAYTADELDVLL